MRRQILLCSFYWTMMSTTTTAFLPVVHLRHKSLNRIHQPFLLPGETVGSTTLHALSSGLPTGDSPLVTFFLESLIANGVPALMTIIVIAFAAKAFKKDKSETKKLFDNSNSPIASLYDDLYGDQQQNLSDGQKSMFRRLFGSSFSPLPQNVGVPKQEYLQVTHLNRKLDSYQFSWTAATQSKAKAAAIFRAQSFRRAIGKSFANLPMSTWQKLQQCEQQFLEKGGALALELQNLQTKLTQVSVDDELKAMGLENVYQLDPLGKKDVKEATSTSSHQSQLFKSLSKLQTELSRIELEFVKAIVSIVGPEHAGEVRAALLGDISARGAAPGWLLQDIKERPLTLLLSDGNTQPAVYVTRFPGDATASQVATLREEVTAIVRNAKKGDEVLVVLQTGGGTVTGYGLATAQLLRVKEAGLKLTIAVEQVAASGGYMMCCVADHIVASPFAVLGSIGVISDIPNVYNRLKEEGIEFQTITAGKYKRTLTPTKKVTKEDFEKTKNDVEKIFVLFRDFVYENRPQLDIENIATGETWFGKDALDRKLCDSIKAVDDVLMSFIDQGFDVFEVKYQPPPSSPLLKLLPTAESALSTIMREESSGGFIINAVRWLAKILFTELQAETKAFEGNLPIEERYQAKIEDPGRFRLDS